MGLLFLLTSLFLIPATLKAGVQFTTVATSNAIGGVGLSIPSINDEGTVVFVDTSPGRLGIYSGNGGPLTAIATSPAIYFSPYSAGGGTAANDIPAPAINDAGVVAFYARTDIAYDQGILSGTQSGLTTIATSPGPPSNKNAISGALRSTTPAPLFTPRTFRPAIPSLPGPVSSPEMAAPRNHHVFQHGKRGPD